MPVLLRLKQLLGQEMFGGKLKLACIKLMLYICYLHFCITNFDKGNCFNDT